MSQAAERIDAALRRYRAADAAGDDKARDQAHDDMVAAVAQAKRGAYRCDETALLVGVAGWVAPW